MKTIHLSGIRGLILATALGVSVGFAPLVFAQTAVIVNPDGKVTYLGTLGGPSSTATSINNSGQVVGYSGYSYAANYPYHAFITGPNGMGMTDLNSIVDLPDGRYLSSAQGINNEGQVIATVAPEPASYALMLAGLGLVGFMARSKNQAAQVSCKSAPV